MNARDMFEELGYRCYKTGASILYINYSDDKVDGMIEFYYSNFTFDAVDKNCGPLRVNVKELEAINKQCEELGWLEKEERAETNCEHYKDEIIEGWMLDLALVDGKLKRCSSVDCDECEFNPGANKGCKQRIIEWLKKPYEKPKYKLTQFEYDLLSVHKDYKTYNNIANQIHLFKMREKGYFKNIDTKIPIREILDNCEVIE